MKSRAWCIFALASARHRCFLPSCSSPSIRRCRRVSCPRAKQLHDRAIVIDTHDDTTQRLLFDKTFDIGVRHKNGNIDIPRMREGGLDALFFSIWVPATSPARRRSRRALDQIDAVREAVRTHPNDLCSRRPPPTSAARPPRTRSRR